MIFDSIYAFFAAHAIEILEGITIVAFDSRLLQNYYSVIDLMAENSSLIGLFIRPSTLISASLTIIAIVNFEKIYRLAIWVKNRIKFN